MNINKLTKAQADGLLDALAKSGMSKKDILDGLIEGMKELAKSTNDFKELVGMMEHRDRMFPGPVDGGEGSNAK